MSYTIVINGKPEGPYSLEELKTMPIMPGTFIRKPGMDDYKEAHEFEELRGLFGFRYLKTAPQYFASFDQRLLAMAIDYFLITMVYVLLLLLLFIVVGEKEQRIAIGLTLLPLIPLAKMIYNIIADASVHQGTLGKRALDIRVSDMLGRRISIGVSISRNLGKLVSMLPLFFGYLYCFLNRKQQCWHDIIADTLVIKQRLL